MTELRLSEAAAADLAQIFDWSAEQFGVAVANDYLAAIGNAFDLLKRHPEAGAERGDLKRRYRALPCRSHRIFYAIDRKGVRIVRVLHMAMSAERLLQLGN